MIEKWNPDDLPIAGRTLIALGAQVRALREEVEAWQKGFQPYLQEGETPVECLERQRRDISALLTLLATSRERELALLGVIETLEWAGVEDAGVKFYCPACLATKDSPHGEGCPIGAALKRGTTVGVQK